MNEDEKLDQATRDVAWEEFDKEGEREGFWGYFGPLTFMRHWFRRVPLRAASNDPVSEPVDDPDPGDERGLRDVLRGDDKST